MTVTRRQLVAAGSASARSAARRDQLIAQAVAEGWKQAEVAEATGLTQGRVSQIVASAKRKGEET